MSEPLSAHLGHSILFRSDTNESFCDSCGVLLDLTPQKTTETRCGMTSEPVPGGLVCVLPAKHDEHDFGRWHRSADGVDWPHGFQS